MIDEKLIEELLATPNIYWNGEVCSGRKCRVRVGTVEQPTWWCAGMEGTERDAVVVIYEGSHFFLDNEDNKGWRKVTLGLGSPRWGHRSLPDDSEIISIEPLPTHEEFEDDINRMDLIRVLETGNKSLKDVPKDFRGWSDAFRHRNRIVGVRSEQETVEHKKIPGAPKGKAQIKAAKRERVKLLKMKQLEQE